MARWRFLAFLAPFTALCLLFQAWVGAWDADLGLTSDEAAHYINSLLLLDYLREAFPANPLTFARAYYAHLPRVSVGHWPPAFYAVQAAVSAVAGRSTAVAVGFQGVIAGATAAAAATLVRDRAGLAAGVAAGLAVLAAPSLLFDMDAVMLDTALSLLVLCSALLWARFSQRRDVLSAAAFALCASAAILTKGNGFGLALLPLCHAAISRDARPLRTPWAWGAAALVAVLTLPWHVATFGMQASGFNYAFGPDYTGRALPFYAGAAVREFGAVGAAGFLLGLLRIARPGAGRADPTLAAVAGGAVASLLFTLAAPADLAPRYLITALPCAAVVAATGLFWLGALLFRRPAAAGAFAAALLLADAAVVFRPPHVSDLGLTAFARRVLADPDGGATVLVAGSPRAEGGLIAAFGALDPGHTHYVLRGTQQLGGGDFMGTRYQARFTDPAALRAWLGGSGVSWLLLDGTTEGLALAHDGQAVAAMDPPPPGWSVVGQHMTATGPITLFRHGGPSPSPDQLRALLDRAVPNG